MIEDKIEILKSQDIQFSQISQVIDNLSNEWRQPISYLSSQILYLQTLQKIGTDKQVAQELNKMLPFLTHSIEKMSSTVNLFSSFYSATNAKSVLCVKEQIHNIVAMHRQKIILHNIDVKIDCDKNLKLNTYKNSLDNLLMILFENAIESFEASRVEGAVIEMNLKQQNKGMVMRFRDNGVGIASHNKEKIFDPSFTTKKNSSGLGLAIAKIIAKERLEGDIKLITCKNPTEFELTIG